MASFPRNRLIREKGVFATRSKLESDWQGLYSTTNNLDILMLWLPMSLHVNNGFRVGKITIGALPINFRKRQHMPFNVCWRPQVARRPAASVWQFPEGGAVWPRGGHKVTKRIGEPRIKVGSG